MRTQEFLNLLKEHQGKSLLFEYLPKRIVKANYHITEVKHIHVDSVDCGARTDSWNETIVQLWESPKEKNESEYMTAKKASEIFNKVDGMNPFRMNSEVKIEYGNTLFHTAQLFIDDHAIVDNNIIFKLAVQETDCKAKEVCEIDEQPINEASCCEPASGCC